MARAFEDSVAHRSARKRPKRMWAHIFERDHTFLGANDDDFIARLLDGHRRVEGQA